MRAMDYIGKETNEIYEDVLFRTMIIMENIGGYEKDMSGNKEDTISYRVASELIKLQQSEFERNIKLLSVLKIKRD